VARLAAIGLVAGVFSSLFGVGGGIVIVPLLVLVSHYATREAAAVSLGAIGITAVAGVIAYAARGEVRPGYAALVGIPAACGAALGAAGQQRLSSNRLLLGFAALLVVLGVWLLVG
jgi:uncharacterized membrane protein YfcA